MIGQVPDDSPFEMQESPELMERPKQACSLQRGAKFVKMPSLAKMTKIRDHKVAQMLCVLPQSPFYLSHVKDVRRSLSTHSARRHLAHLTLLNDKEKSRLARVKEESVQMSSVSGA